MMNFDGLIAYICLHIEKFLLSVATEDLIFLLFANFIMQVFNATGILIIHIKYLCKESERRNPTTLTKLLFPFFFSVSSHTTHTFDAGTSEHSTYIVQTLDFHLGHNTMVTKPCGALESPMATITKITRRRHENPPHGVASVKEWFNYVTATRNEG